MSEKPQGQSLSLWIATAEGTDYASLGTDIDVDTAVIGGGVAGLTAALALKRAGQSVAVIEAARVGTGVTGHTTGKVTSLHRLVYTELAGRHGPDAARSYGQANQAAVEHIARVVSAEGIDCGFRRVPNFTYAETDEALSLVRNEAALAARLGLPSIFTADVPLPFAVKGAVRFDNQAQLHAVRYLQGLARAVDGAGSFVFEDSLALALRDGSPVVVETERGSIRARDVIVATNVPFGDQGSFAARNILHRSYLVASRAGSAPLEGTYISVDEPMRSILAVDIDGIGYVLAGGEGHRAEDSGDTAERYRRLAAFSRDRLGSGEPVFRWSTQDGIPVDGLPYVGPMSPASAHVHVITGLRKWGLTNGTAAALILADTLCGRPNPWARVFDSNRKPPAGGPGPAGQSGTTPPLIQEAAPRPEGKDAPIVPAPGEGVVIEKDGEKIAVYADPAGKSRSVSAICTHLGCTVEFNAADVTWDCPCHGSRFATDGSVIQGPASTNLASRPAPPKRS
ncbi:FAD-dependent oxidoreductase [Arthrobacter sp. SO3]|uniref:FAD-dependent oxidoreductase n=1 Tax=Arthrobacter sp. SO3 TaxID=1897057 RepID=UPI001CFFFBB0|nr:FAD-dependent oxidoreductase [Arthrobacter sp. SO3]MCB5292395.1 Gamma-glutamylputrescine oxidoreductase [Arthrobacter sp. SO3]